MLFGGGRADVAADVITGSCATSEDRPELGTLEYPSGQGSGVDISMALQRHLYLLCIFGTNFGLYTAITYFWRLPRTGILMFGRSVADVDKVLSISTPRYSLGWYGNPLYKQPSDYRIS